MSRLPEAPIEPQDGFGLHARQDGAVGVQGERNARVAESFAHNLGVHPGEEQMRGVRMAEIVEPDPRQIEAFSSSRRTGR
jgi:hypothetical protein